MVEAVGPRRTRVRALVGIVLLALPMLLTSCAAPDRQYVAAGGTGMYFALPAAWSQVPERQLATAQSGWSDDVGGVLTQSILWQGAWGVGRPDANDVFAGKAPSTPVVWAMVRDLIDVERQGIDSVASALADLVIPATELTDAGLDIRSEPVRSGKFRGIHQFATYATGGALQTVEVVSVLSPERDRVYTVVARCTETCFADASGTIADIFDSLTFKETRG